jgi:hypothetical protein
LSNLATPNYDSYQNGLNIAKIESGLNPKSKKLKKGSTLTPYIKNAKKTHSSRLCRLLYCGKAALATPFLSPA